MPVVAVGGGRTEFLQVGGQKKKIYDMDSSELVFLQNWGMKIKVKESLLFGGEWRVGADRSKGG